MMKRSALLAILVLSISQLLFSQANGSFSGTVTDKTGSVVAGATVKITSQDTGLAREAKTDDTGHYIVPLLPVSKYTVRVEAQGFQAVEQKDTYLQVNESRELNFALNPASVSSTVEVSATEVAVQTTNATLGQVITAQQVADLPLNGRDFVQLATLTPGTTQETNPNSFFNGGPSSEVSTRGTYSLSVGGSRAQSTDWLLDGNDNNELTGGGIAILPSIDAIQEFKVLTYNYSAEFGTRAGPTVLVTTKSGANQLHGSLFEFFRNTKLDATSKFASEREQFNLNQFGGALGGAIQKDKTFFFLDYQAKRQRHGQPFVGVVPTPDMIAGDFSKDPFGVPRPGTFDGSVNADGFGDIQNPYTFNNFSFTPFQCDDSGNPLPANSDGTQAAGVNCNKVLTTGPNMMADPVGLKLMQLYPVANAIDPTNPGINYTNVPVRSLNEGEFDVRLDHNFSSKDSAFARFSYDQANSFVPGGSPGFAAPSPFASSQNISNHGRNVAVSETHVFSDRTVNQFSAGFNRIFNHILSFGDRTCKSAEVGIQGGNLDPSCPGAPDGITAQSKKDCMSCGLTTILNVGGYWSLGDRGFAPFQGGTNVFSVADSFDMIRGKHDIRIGFGFRANQMNVETDAFQDGFFVMVPIGLYSLDAAADTLLGQTVVGRHDQTFAGATTGRRWKMFRPYIQDEWRVTNNLTLNLGLGWALTTPVKEAKNRQANFDFPSGKLFVAGNGLGLSGCDICVKSDGAVGIDMDMTALEPRIGIAWKPFGSQNTAVRAGYAIFHDSSWNQGAQGLWENPPYFAETNTPFAFPNCPYGNVDQPCGFAHSFLPSLVAPPDPTTFTGTLQSQNRNFKLGRVQQFNINVEHQLFGNLVLTAGYAGSRSHHILVDGLNLNVSSPNACAGGINPQPGYTLGCGPGGEFVPAPYPAFGIISNINDSGNAKYDSLQIKGETKSAKHGLYALLGYTYAKTYDSGLNDGLGSTVGAPYFPLPGFAKLDWGLSQLNVNHTFTASVVYDLPFGKGKQFGGSWNGALNTVLGDWQVNVIERLLSGFPVFVVDSINNSGVNFNQNAASTNRPDQTCSGETSHHSVDKWFDTSCFSAPIDGELGNAKRAPVNGPNFINTDFSLIKHLRLPFRDGMQLDFRAEFFNLFNHPQLGLPNADIAAGPSQFGKVNSTVNNPRLMQFALKFRF